MKIHLLSLHILLSVFFLEILWSEMNTPVSLLKPSMIPPICKSFKHMYCLTDLIVKDLRDSYPYYPILVFIRSVNSNPWVYFCVNFTCILFPINKLYFISMFLILLHCKSQTMSKCKKLKLPVSNRMQQLGVCLFS